MKKTNRLIFILIAVIFVIQASFMIIYFTNKEPTATNIFSSNINSIVELKCESTDATSYGTAIIYDDNGYLITNTHVVTIRRGTGVVEYSSYSVRFANEQDYRQVELVTYDNTLDLAILRFVTMPEFKLKPIKFGSINNLKAGDKVYAIGNSINQGISISQGIIGIPIIDITYSDRIRTVIQSDIIITEGNSGGALLDFNGCLIGITTFRIKDNSGTIVYGIAYSIPINIIETYLFDFNCV